MAEPRTGRHLGRRFGLLWSASTLSNVGDGLAFTAFPLLAARLTRDPIAISVVTAAATFPAVVLGLLGGVVVDRLDRRQVLVAANVFCAVVTFGLVAAIGSGHLSVAGLVAFSAAIGAGACVFAIASQTIIPSLVGAGRERLGRANSRIFSSEVLGVQLAGPAVGGALFALSRNVPFALDALSFVASAALIAAISGRYRVVSADDGGPGATSVKSSIREGIAWVVRSPFLRSYTLVVAAGNLAVAAQEAVLVVLAERRLHVGASGFGLLFASFAVGGFAATAMGGRLGRKFHEASVLRAGLALLPVGAILTGAAPDAVVCGVGLAVTSFGVMTLNVAASPLRQAIVPPDMLGRVYSASILLGRAALPLGAVLGGLLASHNRPRLPYLAGAVLLVVVGLAGAPGLSRGTINAARAEAARTP